MSSLLQISDLALQFGQGADARRVVDGVSLHLRQGEMLGLVGESGSGKSLTALSVMGLLPPAARVAGGSIRYCPEHGAADLLNNSAQDWQRIRGREIAMIFQEPMSSLNPVFRCGEQVAEALRWHFHLSAEEARSRTLQWLRRVQLDDAERIYRAYPHQLSGGQKQRVMIAMALCCQPGILIADEPTTALDVTVQQAILRLLRQLHEEENLSTLFISHDLGVIGALCHRVAVMHQGQVVEEGPVQQILRQPGHPYTRRLLAARPSLRHQYHRLSTGASPDAEEPLSSPRLVSAAEMAQRRASLYASPPLLRAEQLGVRFAARKNWLGMPAAWLQAVDQASFEVYAGETFGIAGESGCGKTTLGRTLACLQPASAGAVWYSPAGAPPLDLLRLPEQELRVLRR
ncbi:MAG TPA: ABC transporter ATP-binding protein, partial [Saprospiraceae bacterium]|nr:ABC transporter ATP-binding protein [Saprospiraceae bacterium]